MPRSNRHRSKERSDFELCLRGGLGFRAALVAEACILVADASIQVTDAHIVVADVGF